VHRSAFVRLAQVGLALSVAVAAFVGTTRIAPALAGSLSLHPLARASQPFLPDDTAGGRPGEWQELQWNFAGPYGVDAPRAWANLIAAAAPGGAGVTVAVLDTGVAYTSRKSFRRSPDLAGTRYVSGL
jgi:serine protease